MHAQVRTPVRARALGMAEHGVLQQRDVSGRALMASRIRGGLSSGLSSLIHMLPSLDLLRCAPAERCTARAACEHAYFARVRAE